MHVLVPTLYPAPEGGAVIYRPSKSQSLRGLKARLVGLEEELLEGLGVLGPVGGDSEEGPKKLL